ncbi:Aste57867_24870 [Aphanomyces stellatus]|uniref:Aste57867_24870 protein n=1 Tax=Aphanomyces stellatus TaxID=120398 RepID=A0A485LRN9_9STRA|nr:hypothetical protein As57867_024792 [Aphanomyces stellatus]VFU01504.1 Aste57867_24870 [Aphanomyces stellatus]
MGSHHCLWATTWQQSKSPLWRRNDHCHFLIPQLTAMGLTFGHAFFATGALHCVVGCLVPQLYDPLLDLIRDGWFNACRDYYPDGRPMYDRHAGFWFQMSGLLMMFSGGLMTIYTRDTKRPLPASVGFALAGIGAVGAATMPKSGFWLCIIQGGLIVRAAMAGHNKSA